MTFAADLVALYPQLTKFARALKRGRDGVEDLVQDTMAQAWRKQHLFEPGTNLESWTVTIMRNMHHTAGRIAMQRRVELPPPVDRHDADQEDVVLLQEVVAYIGGYKPRFRPLRAGARDLLPLRAMGWSNDELAAMLGIPLGTMKSRINHARTRVRAFAEV